MDVKPAKEEQTGAQSQPAASNSTKEDKPEAMSAEQPDLAKAAMSVDDDATGGKTQPSDGVELQTPDESKQSVLFTMFRSPIPSLTVFTGSKQEADETYSPPSRPTEEFSSTRSVSTFRGRTIQGLKVDLPQGYRGLLLEAPAPSTTSSSSSKNTSSSSKAASSSSKPQPDPLEEPPTTSTRRRGRLTRSAVSKRVIDVEAEEAKKAKEAAAAAIDVDAPMDVDNNEDESTRDNTPQRRLKPVSQFSSFTIWHADNPVIESQDEYYRSMHEWTALAAAVSLVFT
jgi:hypothetical protein